MLFPLLFPNEALPKPHGKDALKGSSGRVDFESVPCDQKQSGKPEKGGKNEPLGSDSFGMLAGSMHDQGEKGNDRVRNEK